MRTRTSWLWVIALALLIAAASALYAWQWLQVRPTITTDVIYEVPRGTGFSAIARDLQAKGMLEHPRLWSLWARKRGVTGAIKAGEYALRPGLTPDALLNVLTSGQVILHSITIVEGTTYRDLRAELRKRPDVKQTLNGVSDTQLMQRLGLDGVHPEGQFFPDTYQYAKGTTDVELLGVAQRRMQRELAAAWEARDPALELKTPYEALILASIVEKETALSSERPLIAGVFLDRLNIGMKLQTDPTVIYGIGEQYDGDIRRRDLLRDTPYNTYTRDGLPPTPICLPGAAALQAVAKPQRSGALFFVATGRGDGSHYFSKTLAEHNRALAQYLKTLRAARN